VNVPHVLNRNLGIEVEDGMPEAVLADLARRGHKIKRIPFKSGLQAIEVMPDGTMRGAADRRREGRVMGR